MLNSFSPRCSSRVAVCLSALSDYKTLRFCAPQALILLRSHGSPKASWNSSVQLAGEISNRMFAAQMNLTVRLTVIAVRYSQQQGFF